MNNNHAENIINRLKRLTWRKTKDGLINSSENLHIVIDGKTKKRASIFFYCLDTKYLSEWVRIILTKEEEEALIDLTFSIIADRERNAFIANRRSFMSCLEAAEKQEKINHGQRFNIERRSNSIFE